MIHSGEWTTNGIRCRFNPSIGINFQGAKISSDTGILLPREIDERFGITSALEGILQDSKDRVTHPTPLDWPSPSTCLSNRRRLWRLQWRQWASQGSGPSSGSGQKQRWCGKPVTLVTIWKRIPGQPAGTSSSGQCTPAEHRCPFETARKSTVDPRSRLKRGSCPWQSGRCDLQRTF